MDSDPINQFNFHIILISNFYILVCYDLFKDSNILLIGKLVCYVDSIVSHDLSTDLKGHVTNPYAWIMAINLNIFKISLKLFNLIL